MNNIALNVVEQLTKTVKEDLSLGITKWNAHLNWKDGTENNIAIRNFPTIVVDEPTELGGTNKAPNPVEYLLTGAVSKYSISFEIFASMEGIKLEKLDVDIEADINLAVFLGLMEGERGILNPTIKLNAVTSASFDKVKEIANRALASSVVLNSLKAKVELVVE